MASRDLLRAQPQSSESGAPRRVSPPTTPICRTAAPSRRAASSGRQVTTAWPPPSPNHATPSSGSWTVAPTPAKSAASASAIARPPSAASCALVRKGAERTRKPMRAASATSFGSAGRPAGPPKKRAWYSEPSRRTSGEPATYTRSPSRQAPGIARTSSTNPDTADHGRRVDRAPVGLVVERDVAGDDGHAEGLARLRHPLDRLGELPGDLRLLRVPEVEAVRDRDRRSARTGDVSSGLEDGERTAGARVERGDPAGSVQRQREPANSWPEAEHGCVEAWPANRPRSDQVVVPAEDGPAAGDVRGAEEVEEVVTPGRIRGVSTGGSSGRGAVSTR